MKGRGLSVMHTCALQNLRALCILPAGKWTYGRVCIWQSSSVCRKIQWSSGSPDPGDEDAAQCLRCNLNANQTLEQALAIRSVRTRLNWTVDHARAHRVEKKRLAEEVQRGNVMWCEVGSNVGLCICLPPISNSKTAA